MGLAQREASPTEKDDAQAWTVFPTGIILDSLKSRWERSGDETVRVSERGDV